MVPTRRAFPIVLFLFVGSGAAALIYEVVWFQLLELVIGSSAVSLALLLATYMGGMCLGSLVLPRLLPTRLHPLRLYAWFEAGIGAFGLLVLAAMPVMVKFYTALAGPGFAGLLVRGSVSAVCLLVPTTLMGATLPIVSRWLETTPRGVSRMGFLYGTNTAGAVLGCLLAGFYLLRVHDLAAATYAAAALNVVVAAGGFALARRTGRAPAAAESSPAAATAVTPASNHHRWPVLIAIALSGMSALGAEVVWTRLLSLLLGATVYTFSIILAVFLAGLAIGSTAGAAWGRRTARPLAALGLSQILLTGAIAWTAFILAKSLPFWPVNPQLAASPWAGFQLDLLRCFYAVFPATFFWGASFPLALAAIAPGGVDPGRDVGRVYAANTIGAIAGSLGFGLLFIPWLGSRSSERLLIGLALAGSAVSLVPLLRPFFRPSKSALKEPWLRIAALIGAEAAIALILIVPKTPWQLIAYGRDVPRKLGQADPLFVGEGGTSSVAVTQLRDDSGTRNFHVSGKVEASSDPADMRLERMLGHIPALIHPAPRSVLVVGCGAGVTAGSFLVHPTVQRVVICEIEPLVPRVVARFFGAENYELLEDSRVQVVYDDARHFMLTAREKFDIITSDPIHPWVKGSATLYTNEYFAMCRRRLNPGGVMSQWVPLYDSSEDVVRSEVATFFGVFPGGTIWGNDILGMGYDVVLLGRDGTTKIDVDGLEARLDRPDHTLVAASLREIKLGTAVALLSTYAGRTQDLGPWLEGAAINRDRNLRLQFIAGLALNASHSITIYDRMLAHRRYPEELFLASEPLREELRKSLEPLK
jgi:spermidine synthase